MSSADLQYSAAECRSKTWWNSLVCTSILGQTPSSSEIWTPWTSFSHNDGSERLWSLKISLATSSWVTKGTQWPTVAPVCWWVRMQPDSECWSLLLGGLHFLIPFYCCSHIVESSNWLHFYLHTCPMLPRNAIKGLWSQNWTFRCMKCNGEGDAHFHNVILNIFTLLLLSRCQCSLLGSASGTFLQVDLITDQLASSIHQVQNPPGYWYQTN